MSNCKCKDCDKLTYTDNEKPIKTCSHCGSERIIVPSNVWENHPLARRVEFSLNINGIKDPQTFARAASSEEFSKVAGAEFEKMEKGMQGAIRLSIAEGKK
jgi:NAD-dependent SIR2 family protein deacetylase